MNIRKVDRVKEVISTTLPEPLADVARSIYYTWSSDQREEEIHKSFVDEVFGDRSRYQSYSQEVHHLDLFQEGMNRYEQIQQNSGGIVSMVLDYYALIREFEPDVVIETGVCNGVSTLVALLAMDQNDNGHLYSVDYPFYADESLEEFRTDTFESYGGAAIPTDKEPGWIVPDSLKSRWTLTIGKTQVELPKLRNEVDTIDMFFHDSEHSEPCMMFEYELAWEWMDSGILLSDDIDWNDAFDTFTSLRSDRWGKINSTSGYAIKE